MTVIAMSQEMGTLGRDVAAGVTQALGLRLVRHEIGDAAADRMRVKKSLIRRFREGQLGWFEKRRVEKSSLELLTAEQVYDRALEGDALIRGWGATILLFPVRHVPCLRICAPLENRVKWLMERLDTDDPQIARDEIERSDSAHTARIHQTFGVTLGDPLLYDMVLNTGRISIPSCIDQVIELSRRPEFQPTPDSIAFLRNRALQARIQAALGAHESGAQIDITLEVDGGRVVLRGVVVDDREKKLAADLAREVSGVTDVENELRVMNARHGYPDARED
ncbi:MAG: cytidylate kinase family protein [Casimicrobiaceae bacterium]